MDCKDLQNRVRDLEYERDREADLRSQYEYAEAQRNERARREREEQRRANLPSNRLHNGEISNFCEAVRLHSYCLQGEMGLCIESDSDPACGGSPEKGEKTRKDFETWLANCTRAVEIYQSVYKDAEAQLRKQVADQLRAEGSGFDQFAECLESQDYSGLAI